MTRKDFFSAVTTTITVLCAVIVTTAVVRRADAPRRSGAARIAQPDWLSYASGGRRLGPVNAKIVLVEFSDFQCPACLALHQRIENYRERASAPFAVMYRHLPLDIHPFARPAAQASECAALQGHFEQMHDLLFANQKRFGTIAWSALARDAGVPDGRLFARCMDDSLANARIDRDLADAKRLDANGTPVLLINGVRVGGAPPQAALDSLIREAQRSR